MIGSGVYIDDMQVKFYGQVWQATFRGVVIALVMALLVILIARSIMRPLQNTVNAMANIASCESDLTRSLDTQGHDQVAQLAQLARHFNTFTTKSCQVITELQVSVSARGQSSSEMGNDATQAQQHSQQQSQQMELVTTVINEVTYGVQDVFKYAPSGGGHQTKRHPGRRVVPQHCTGRAAVECGQCSIERPERAVERIAQAISRVTHPCSSCRAARGCVRRRSRREFRQRGVSETPRV